MKPQIYSWRVATERKTALEDTARRIGISLSALLDRITGEWLQAHRPDTSGDEEQRRLHAAAAACSGQIAGGRRRGAENARAEIRKAVMEKKALARKNGR